MVKNQVLQCQCVPKESIDRSHKQYNVQAIEGSCSQHCNRMQPSYVDSGPMAEKVRAGRHSALAHLQQRSSGVRHPYQCHPHGLCECVRPLRGGWCNSRAFAFPSSRVCTVSQKRFCFSQCTVRSNCIHYFHGKKSIFTGSMHPKRIN